MIVLYGPDGRRLKLRSIGFLPHNFEASAEAEKRTPEVDAIAFREIPVSDEDGEVCK